MTPFEFSTASARARIVTTGPRESALALCSFFGEDVHDICRRAPGTEQGRHSLHRTIDVGEKALITLAQVVQPGFTSWRALKAVLRTASVACKAHFALTTITRKRVSFGLSKSMLPFRGDQLR